MKYISFKKADVRNKGPITSHKGTRYRSDKMFGRYILGEKSKG